MSKIRMFLPLFVWAFSLQAFAADRDPLLMGGLLGDGVNIKGWATDQCFTGTPVDTPYKSTKITYTIEKTKKNNEDMIEIKVLIAKGEIQLEDLELTVRAKKARSKSPEHFQELCGQYYSGYIYGATMSIARKTISEKPISPLSIGHSDSSKELLKVIYPEYLKEMELTGVWMHMNPVESSVFDIVGNNKDVDKIIHYVTEFQNKKAESKIIIQPFKSNYK